MKNSNNKLIPLSIGIAGLAWAIGILIWARAQAWDIPFDGTLVFGVFAVVVAIVYLVCFRYSPDRQAEEVGALSIITTVVYVAVALIRNTAMMLIGKGGINAHMLTFNMILVACYVILILFMERNVRQVTTRLDRTEQKTATPTNISAKLGALLSVAEDKELHSRLLKLKEAVNYAINITTANTAAQEQQMAALLDELMELIVAEASQDAISSKLQQVERCWKLRSSAASFL